MDYWALNRRMKADKFPLPKIEKVLEELAGSKIFSKVDMFAGYRQIKLAVGVQGKSALRCKFRCF